MPIALKGLHAWGKADDVELDGRHNQLVVWPHHPDQLRRPAARPGALHADSLQRAPHVLADIERALARNALTWLAGVGIVPVTERSI
jgi:hypothetical protein